MYLAHLFRHQNKREWNALKERSRLSGVLQGYSMNFPSNRSVCAKANRSGPGQEARQAIKRPLAQPHRCRLWRESGVTVDYGTTP